MNVRSVNWRMWFTAARDISAGLIKIAIVLLAAFGSHAMIDLHLQKYIPEYQEAAAKYAARCYSKPQMDGTPPIINPWC